MVINIFVNVEPGECIECICEWKTPQNRLSPAKYWKKMWCTKNRIKVDDRSIIIWLDYPHACAFIWWIAHTREPAHESTGVFNAFIREWKQQSNTGNIETSHTFQRWVSVDKDRVIAAGPLPPRLYCVYTLTMHATNAWDIARRIESGNGGSVDRYLAIKCGEVHDTGIRIETLLVANKFLDEMKEVRFFNFGDNIFRVNFVCCKSR